MTQLQVNILSPSKVVTRTSSEHVLAPGLLGCLGILPGHTRFLSELGLGELKIDSAQGAQVYFVAGGYLDVDLDVITVLADVIEAKAEINVARAEKSKVRALDRLGKPTPDLDVGRAMRSLERAEKRLAIARRVN